MHPFPPAADLQCFIGDTIAQVTLDPYGVQFSFESMRRLVAEFGIEQIEPNGTVWPYDCEAAEGPPLILHRLLYRRIVAVEREDLRLTFRIEDGSALAILADVGSYESGHIVAPETWCSDQRPPPTPFRTFCRRSEFDPLQTFRIASRESRFRT